MSVAWLRDIFGLKKDGRTEAMKALEKQRRAARRSLETSREGAQSAASVLDGIMNQKRQAGNG